MDTAHKRIRNNDFCVYISLNFYKFVHFHNLLCSIFSNFLLQILCYPYGLDVAGTGDAALRKELERQSLLLVAYLTRPNKRRHERSVYHRGHLCEVCAEPTAILPVHHQIFVKHLIREESNHLAILREVIILQASSPGSSQT